LPYGRYNYVIDITIRLSSTSTCMLCNSEKIIVSLPYTHKRKRLPVEKSEKRKRNPDRDCWLFNPKATGQKSQCRFFPSCECRATRARSCSQAAHAVPHTATAVSVRPPIQFVRSAVSTTVHRGPRQPKALPPARLRASAAHAKALPPFPSRRDSGSKTLLLS
jgi:hypothetical protein